MAKKYVYWEEHNFWNGFFFMSELKPFSRALRFFSLKLNLNLV